MSGTLLARAKADGVEVSLAAGVVKAKGDRAAVDRWLPILCEHKPEILAALEAKNELAALILAVFPTGSPEELEEALAATAAYPDTALLCYRTLAKAGGMSMAIHTNSKKD